MFKLPFNKTKTDPTKFLAVTISSDYVKCGLFNYDPEAKTCNIIGYGKENLPHGIVRNGNIIDIDNLGTYLTSAKNKALQNNDKISHDANINRTIFGVAGEVVTGITTTLKVTRSHPNPIDEKESAEYYANVTKAAYDQIGVELYKTRGIDDYPVEIVSTSPVYAKINNHTVEELVGYVGEIVELAVYHAFCASSHTTDLQKLAKKTGLEILAIVPESYAILKCFQENQEDKLDSVFINVGSDYTDIDVIFGGGIVSHRTLPLGRTHFNLELSKVMGLSYPETLSKLVQYSNEKLSEPESLSIHKVLEEVSFLWLEGLQLAFEEFEGVRTFGEDTYLVGEGASLPEFLYLLKTEDWFEAIPFKAAPKVSRIYTDELSTIKDNYDLTHTVDDLGLISLAGIYTEIYDAN